MNDQIKSKIVFDSPQAPQTKKKETLEEQLDSKYVFADTESEAFQLVDTKQWEEDNEGEVEGIVYNTLTPKKSLWRKVIGFSAGLFVVSAIAQSGEWIYRSFVEHNWINLGMATAGGLIVVAGAGTLFTEWKKLRNLKQRTDERETAKTLLSSHAMGSAKPFCEKILQQSNLSKEHPAYLNWQKSLHESQSDKEVMELYAKIVQPVLDKQAKRLINRYSAESALMIAVSPLAIVDMMFIAWRNIKLINQIARLYGMELGYFSRIKLFRLVLINIAFAGATELISEVGMDWMSQDLMAKLSGRAAQGVGAGLLTARLGIKAMELCRPIPWLNDKPRLADFRKELIGQLKGVLTKGSQGK